MNKAQARRYVYRLICGLIDNFEQHTKEPLCYDDPFYDPDVMGRRLSDQDHCRVDDALELIYKSFNDKGWSKYWNVIDDRRGPSWSELKPKPFGKPGAKWKGWQAFKERCCR